jgi:hypothetical protein
MKVIYNMIKSLTSSQRRQPWMNRMNQKALLAVQKARAKNDENLRKT